MTQGQVVSLEDGSKAQVREVKLSSWQTMLVAVVLPPSEPKPH